jgi:Family of unknown function (DUF6418)
MMTLVFAALVFGLFAWMLKARLAATIAATFVLFGLVSRTASLIYLDLFGPTFSEQLQFEVGGGTSMPLFAGSVLMFMLPLVFLFRSKAAARLLQVRNGRRLYDSAGAGTLLLWITMSYAVATYLEMLVRGPVPLFVGMDRLEYNNVIAGPLHGLLVDHGWAIAFMQGIAFVLPRLSGGDFRPAAFGAYVLTMIYFSLTGNRFSAFFAYTSFFVIPLAALPLMRAAGQLGPPPVERSHTVALLIAPATRLVLVAVLGASLTAMLLHSVINVRAYEDPVELFFQRIVVQPVELWWATFAELDTRPPDSFADAWDGLFINALDPTRNTSVRLLMINSLGFERAAELADFGTQFAGGYPEIFFVMLGPWLALPVALVFGLVTCWLLRLVVRAICLGRVGTALTGIYVFYGFTLLYIGGMLNFLIVWTYWVKVGALLLVMFLERNQVAWAGAGTLAMARSTIIPVVALRRNANPSTAP